jgi:hypothetical protein
VSLASLIGAGKPVAALFATPARCSSQYCGPVLDEMLHIMAPYQDRITFVHTEIYQAVTGTALVLNTASQPPQHDAYDAKARGKVTFTASQRACTPSPGQMACGALIAWTVTIEVK